MNTAEWILVAILSITLFIFLVVGIVLVVKLIALSDEIKQILATGQSIADKADDIVDNVKGMTSVGGIVKNFTRRAMQNQERRYAEQDAARAAADEVVDAIIDDAIRESDTTQDAAHAASRKTTTAGKTASHQSKTATTAAKSRNRQ